MTTTTVNAGFIRWHRLPNARRPSRDWKNVQGIVVPLPESELGSQEFRDHIRKSAPPGEGWTLQGYAIAKPK